MKKKIGILLMVIAFVVSLAVINVNAAQVPYAWSAGGEMIDGSSSAARVEKDGKIVTLYLNNYSGGKLSLECYGIGQEGMTFNIVLEGTNIITADDVGINFDYDGKINFSGNGTLTINASKPISYENYEKQMYISPSENIYKQGKDNAQSSSNSSQNTKEEGQIVDNNDKQENQVTEESEKAEEEELPVEGMVKDPSYNNSNDLIYSIICIYIVASLTLIIFLIIKVKKLQKNNK